MNELTWSIKHFRDLDVYELYDLIKLRQDVFIIEQTCFYHDMDGLDKESYHVMGRRGEDIVAYARILPPGLSYDQCSIGRVISKSQERGKGTGRQLMERSMDYIDNHLKENEIKISAQSYLLKFYSGLGFEKVSKEYLEDGIPHIDMIRKV